MPEEIQKDTTEELEVTPQGEDQPEELSTSKDQAEDELPEDARDRTKEQFEKLKKSNAELKAELEKRKQLPSVLDYLSPTPQVSPEVRKQYQPPTQPAPVQPPPQPQPTPQPSLVDEQGYVNADVLTKQLSSIEEARKKAEEAERRAIEAERRISRYEQTSEEEKLYQAYPELDPGSESFNQEAYDLVRDRLTSQIVKTGKRDAMSAASEMARYFRKEPPKNQEVIEKRSQVTPATGNSSQRASKPISEMSTQERLKAWHEQNN